MEQQTFAQFKIERPEAVAQLVDHFTSEFKLSREI